MLACFAQLARVQAFIHIDQHLMAETRFGGTDVHGLLLAGLLRLMMRSATPLIRSTEMGAFWL